MNILTTIHYHIRYNHPIWYFLTVALAAIVLIANVITITASNTGFFEAIGATQLKTRIVAGKEALFWQYRAWAHNKDIASVPPQRLYGYMQNVNRDGTINIQVTNNNTYQTMRVSLADLLIQNINSLAAIVELHKTESADIDIYPMGTTTPQAVIWLDNKPFNVDLIIANVAIPDINPPTDIVDRAFAEYHWNIAKGRMHNNNPFDPAH